VVEMRLLTIYCLSALLQRLYGALYLFSLGRLIGLALMSSFGLGSRRCYQEVIMCLCWVWRQYVGRYGRAETEHVLKKKAY
jgi:hypothetical protein